MKMRKMYDGKGDQVSQETGLSFVDALGKPKAIQYVKQSELEGTKIDNILARYAQAGLNPFIDPVQAGQVYGHRITVDEYMDARNIVADATSQFEMLGGEVRKRFNNSVEEFLSFAADPKNTLELDALISEGTRVDGKGYVVERGKRVDFDEIRRNLENPKVPDSKVDKVAQPKPAEAGVPT